MMSWREWGCLMLDLPARSRREGAGLLVRTHGNSQGSTHDLESRLGSLSQFPVQAQMQGGLGTHLHTPGPFHEEGFVVLVAAHEQAGKQEAHLRYVQAREHQEI